MFRQLFRFVFVFIFLQSSSSLSTSINRDGSGTQITFESGDLLRPHGSSNFENDWLVKDLGYRAGCYLQTIPFAIPHQASVEAVVHYEAQWRDVVGDVSELSSTDIARFDIAYDDAKGEPNRDSSYIAVSDLSNLVWLSQGTDFIQVRAQSEGIKTLHIKKYQIPAASTNVRVKMCGIAPQTRLRVERIELKVSDFGQFEEASTSISNGPLRCFDTGLFLSNCRLEETVLDEPNFLEQDYEVDLNFDCCGHDVEFALTTPTSVMPISPKHGDQIVKVTGNGLRMIDRNPDRTRRATFDQGCSFKINRVVKNVSRQQQAELAKQKAMLEAAIENSKVSAQAFVDLNLLAQTFEAIRTALDLANKLNVASSKHKIVMDVSLENLLSKQQNESLKNLLQTKNVLVQSDAQYDRFKKLEEEARQKLRELACLTQGLFDLKGEVQNVCH